MKLGILRIDCVFFHMEKEEALEKSKALKGKHDDVFRANVSKPQTREGLREIAIVELQSDAQEAFSAFISS